MSNKKPFCSFRFDEESIYFLFLFQYKYATPLWPHPNLGNHDINRLVFTLPKDLFL